VGLLLLWATGQTAEAVKNGLQKVLILFFSLFIVFAVMEILFRLPPVVQLTGGNTPGMIDWQLRNYDSVVTNRNALGLRSLNLDKSKPKGIFRIVTLGDSFTWGDKIAHTEDTWPYVVERLLHAKGIRTEVINMAHTGFTTVNNVSRLCHGEIGRTLVSIPRFT
jgi:hypothetical protein